MANFSLHHPLNFYSVFLKLLFSRFKSTNLLSSSIYRSLSVPLLYPCASSGSFIHFQERLLRTVNNTRFWHKIIMQ